MRSLTFSQWRDLRMGVMDLVDVKGTLLKFKQIYTVFQKNVTTFSMISRSRNVRLQRFLAHVLPRVYAINRYF